MQISCGVDMPGPVVPMLRMERRFAPEVSGAGLGAMLLTVLPPRISDRFEGAPGGPV